MSDYKHPELILHLPDFYGPWDGTMHKWKDRFSTSVKTAATSLITYLEWPGDKRRDDWTAGQRVSLPDAEDFGPFAIYRLDEEATAKLREEMRSMDPSKRLDQKPASYYGHSYAKRTTNKAFAKGMREAIARALAG